MRKLSLSLKAMFFILAALFMTQLVPQMVYASNSMTSSDPYTGTSYTIRYDENNNAAIIKYSGSQWEFTVPATIRGFNNTTLTVTSIERNAFKDCTSLRTLTIPDTVTDIGEYAFFGCNNLITVNMPASMTSIGQSAFGTCASLTSMTIPNGITAINDGLFYNCRSLTTVNIPDGITYIGTNAFLNCSSLTNVNIPDSVTKIGSAAFMSCTSLKNIAIPNRVTIIYDQTFHGCTSLTNVTLPEGITRMDDSVFNNCSSLTGIVLPDSLRQTGMFLFSDCKSLKSITIPGNLTRLNTGAFHNCSSLTRVFIPDSVTQFGGSVFSGCSSLKSFVIPDSVTMREGDTFKDCTSLESVKFSSGDTRIHSYDFNNCTSLRSITIPEHIDYLGDHAFDGCSKLTEANFLGDAPYVNDFGVRVFDNCASNFKIKYILGKTGFSNPFHGYPAERVTNFSGPDLTTVTLPGNINPNALENVPIDINPETNTITLNAQAGVGYVKLDWNSITDSKGVSGYNVYKSTRAGSQPNNPVNAACITGITYSDSNVQAGTTYYYIVKPVFKDRSIGTASNEVPASPKGTTGTIQFSIGNPLMKGDGIQKEIDSGFGTAPVIKDGRTFLPIRALIAEMGGEISWDAADSKVTLNYNGNKVELWIGKNNVRVNGIDKTMDVAPYTSSTGRTMLPLKVVGENLGCEVTWDGKTQTATIANYGIGDTPKVNNETTGGTIANTQMPTNIPGTIDTANTQGTAANSASGSWSGTWDTDWGKLILEQAGDKVTGTYDYYEGCYINGTVSGNSLSGTFVEKKGTELEATGLFKFIINDNGISFEGRWGDSDTPKDEWFYWNGEKM